MSLTADTQSGGPFFQIAFKYCNVKQMRIVLMFFSWLSASNESNKILPGLNCIRLMGPFWDKLGDGTINLFFYIFYYMYMCACD